MFGRSAAQDRATARHVCLAAQPRTVNGSPDTLIVRGVEAMLGGTERLAEAIVRAVSGKTNAKAIAAAATAAAKRFGTSGIAEPIRRELLHGALLGALDSWHEGETDEAVPVEAFGAGRASRLLVNPFHDTRFAERPIKEAIAKFLSQKAVTRDVFDAMEKEAQRRAFTVAGMANAEMVNTVKRELIRQVAVGADFADFGKHAAKRFEAAGWTPANPSHVETVFRTNVLGAYNGGRIRQMSQPDVLDVRPYWESLPINDLSAKGPQRHRPTHFNFVLRASDPFWQTAAPPYGYNCRCRIRSLSVRKGASMVREGSSIPNLPDAGFASGIGAMFEGPPPPVVPPTPAEPANDPPPKAAPANDPAPRRRPANDAPPTKALPNDNVIQREIDDLRRRIANISRRRKPSPASEFEALRKRLDELLGAIRR